MIVTFRSKAYADTLMFGDIAVHLLKLMGHSGTVPGALLAEDVPAALDCLRKAIAASKAAAEEKSDRVREHEDDNDGDDDDDSSERTVALAHRALPLIELLEASARAQCNVMWDK